MDQINENTRAFGLSQRGYEEVPFALTGVLAPARVATKRTRRLRGDLT